MLGRRDLKRRGGSFLRSWCAISEAYPVARAAGDGVREGRRHANIKQWVRSCRGASSSVGNAFPDRLQPEEAVSVPIRAGDRLGDLRKAAVDAAIPGIPVIEDHDPLQTAVPFADQQRSGFEPDTFGSCWPAVCKRADDPQLERFPSGFSQAPQDRPVEIPERRGLDPIREHAHDEPVRKMGGSDPAQMVSPLEAKLIPVEVGKAGDQGVERFTL